MKIIMCICTIWVCASLLVLIIYGIYCVIKREELIKKKERKLKLEEMEKEVNFKWAYNGYRCMRLLETLSSYYEFDELTKKVIDVHLADLEKTNELADEYSRARIEDF